MSIDQGQISNVGRADRCERALATYNDEYDVHSNLIDFLADARHWCDRHGKSHAQFDRVAYQHYLAERDITSTPAVTTRPQQDSEV